MRVIALRMGIDHKGYRRRPGDAFDVPDGMKASWFDPVDKAQASGRKNRSAPPAPVALSQMAQQTGGSFVDAVTAET